MFKKYGVVLLALVIMLVSFGVASAADSDVIEFKPFNLQADTLYFGDEAKFAGGIGWDVATTSLGNILGAFGVQKDIAILKVPINLRVELANTFDGEDLDRSTKYGLGLGIDIGSFLRAVGFSWNVPEFSPNLGVVAMSDFNNSDKDIEFVPYLTFVQLKM